MTIVNSKYEYYNNLKKYHDKIHRSMLGQSLASWWKQFFLYIICLCHGTEFVLSFVTFCQNYYVASASDEQIHGKVTLHVWIYEKWGRNRWLCEGAARILGYSGYYNMYTLCIKIRSRDARVFTRTLACIIICTCA